MIYIHIPYCRSFCTYCDFYSEVASRCSAYGVYAEALSAEIAARDEEIRKNVNDPSGIDTLYIGGGTPSVLPLHVFESVLDSLSRVGGVNRFKEFTVEVNPEDVVEKGHSYVEGLLRLGVNRISMGVQSFDDAILKWMNRRHDSARAVRAYSILEECGLDNISIDLIFGLPQLSSDEWERGLDKALGISRTGRLPRHISAYQLSVEEGSALASLVADGKWKEASEEVCACQYESLCDALCSKIETDLGVKVGPRFSAGYGDLSLDFQKNIFNILKCEKIGLTLNQSLSMSPSKSVTAIAGLK